jgi:hypothetical protein
MTPKVVEELPMTSHVEHKTVRVQQSHWRATFLIGGFNPSKKSIIWVYHPKYGGKTEL